MRSIKKAFVMNAISLILCCVMFMGSTWAWFTTSVASGKNLIQAGNLDVELYHAAGSGDTFRKVTDETELFDIEKWEPGVMAYERFKVKNAGDLALKYKLSMAIGDYNTVTDETTGDTVDGIAAENAGGDADKYADGPITNDVNKEDPEVVSEDVEEIVNDANEIADENAGADGINSENTDGDVITERSLKDVLKVAEVPEGFAGTREAAEELEYVTLEEFLVKNEEALLPDSTDDEIGIIIYWEPTEDDEKYNLYGERTATTDEGLTGDTLFIELGVELTATQIPHEKDSFGNTYDEYNIEAYEIRPDWRGESEETGIPGADQSPAVLNVMAEEDEAAISEEVYASASIAGGTKIKIASASEPRTLTENEKVKLSIEPGGTPGEIAARAGQNVTTYDIALYRVLSYPGEGDSVRVISRIEETDKPVRVSLKIGEKELEKIYFHGEKLYPAAAMEGLTDACREYYYDAADGVIYFNTKTFGLFTTIYKEEGSGEL